MRRGRNRGRKRSSFAGANQLLLLNQCPARSANAHVAPTPPLSLGPPTKAMPLSADTATDGVDFPTAPVLTSFPPCVQTGIPGAGGRTASDLPLVALSQAEIEGLESAYPQIEDVLPLAPLQEGLLFHALYDAQAPDIYTVQLELGLEGALDSAAMAAAVQALVARHASLRARFRHAGLAVIHLRFARNCGIGLLCAGGMQE